VRPDSLTRPEVTLSRCSLDAQWMTALRRFRPLPGSAMLLRSKVYYRRRSVSGPGMLVPVKAVSEIHMAFCSIICSLHEALGLERLDWIDPLHDGLKYHASSDTIYAVVRGL
jgi:hypothetical protein